MSIFLVNVSIIWLVAFSLYALAAAMICALGLSNPQWFEIVGITMLCMGLIIFVGGSIYGLLTERKQ